MPQYLDEHTVSLKIVNFNQNKEQKISIKINGVPFDLEIKSDYETHNLTSPAFHFKKR